MVENVGSVKIATEAKDRVPETTIEQRRLNPAKIAGK
jgi:hypothetical protein